MIRFLTLIDGAAHCVAVEIPGTFAAVVARHATAGEAEAQRAFLAAQANGAEQKRDPVAKASGDNGATAPGGEGPADSAAGDASRPIAGGGARDANVSEGVTSPGGENPAPDTESARVVLASADDGRGVGQILPGPDDPGRHPPGHRAARNAAVRRLWEAGTPAPDIARQLGISEQRVYQLRQSLGLKPRPASARKRLRPAPPPPLATGPATGQAAEPDANAPAPEPETAARAEALPEAAPKAAAREVRADNPDDVLTLHGVCLRLVDGDESVTFGGRTMELNAMQARLCACLLRAAPLPVDREFALRAAIIHRVPNEAGLFAGTVRWLSSALAGVGLGLRETKGVGLQITGVAE